MHNIWKLQWIGKASESKDLAARSRMTASRMMGLWSHHAHSDSWTIYSQISISEKNDEQEIIDSIMKENIHLIINACVMAEWKDEKKYK